MASTHNGELEELVRAAPGDPHPRLVYADWLAEREQHEMAAAQRLLAGVAGELPVAVGRWLGLTVVSGAVWQLSVAARPLLDDRTIASDHYDALNGALNQLQETLQGLHRAAVSGAEPPAAPDEVEVPTLAGFPAPARWRGVLRALGGFRDYLRDPDHTAALLDAVVSAREHASVAELEQLADHVIGTARATGASPLTADGSLAAELSAPFEERDVRATIPPDAVRGPFSFARVIINNNNHGIFGSFCEKRPGLTPRALLFALAAEDDLGEGELEAMDTEERLAWIGEDHFLTDDLAWEAMSHLDALTWAHDLLAWNQGELVRVGTGEGEPTPLLDALGAYGAFQRGATMSESDFPYTMLELERGYVLSRVVY